MKELAFSLPRLPKDLPLIILKIKGKENTFKDVTVRREKVFKALLWLFNNNPQYRNIEMNMQSINSLPENGVPFDLMTVETEQLSPTNESVQQDLGPHSSSEDIVYNESSEMSSFYLLVINNSKNLKQ